MLVTLKKTFKTPVQAEESFRQQSPLSPSEVNVESSPPMTTEASTQCTVATVMSMTQTDSTLCNYASSQTDISIPSKEDSLLMLSEMFTQLMAERGVVVPTDFLLKCAVWMEHCAVASRSNVLYNLAKGLGTLRNDGSESLFPCKRMPMGLVEFVCSFFASENRNQVSIIII